MVHPDPGPDRPGATADAPAGPRHDLRTPLAAFLLARAMLSGLGLALWSTGLAPTTADAQLRPYFGVTPVTQGLAGALLGVWQRFDAIHYLRLAAGGYSAPDLSAFFPLYPLLTRWLAELPGIDLLLASQLVANAAAALAVIAFHRLVLEERCDPDLARRATYHLLFFPAGFFLLVPYPESLALLFSLLAFRQARHARWWSAGLAALAGALTRPQGVLILPALLTEAVRRVKGGSRPSPSMALAAVAPLLGLWVFVTWRAAAGFPPLASVQLDYWQWVTAVPFSGLLATVGRLLTGQAVYLEFVQLVVVGAMIAVGFLLPRRVPASFTIYYWTVLLFNLSLMRLTQPISSQARFALALFPGFMVLGELGASPARTRLLLYPSFALWLFLAGQFILWGWVG